MDGVELIAVLACLILGNTAFGIEPSAVPSPTTQPSAASRSLRDERDQIMDGILRLEIEIAEFRLQHPEIPDRYELTRQELLKISDALVDAQLGALSARAHFAAGHPSVRATQQLERELMIRSEKALARLIDASRLAARHQKLLTQLAQQREYFRRLEERLAEQPPQR